MHIFNLLLSACAIAGVSLLLSCGGNSSHQVATPPPVPADVYLAGYESNGSVDVAKYWKNGVPVSLTDGTKGAQALSIAVSGSDVYVAGVEGVSFPVDPNKMERAVTYWKNGVAVVLKGGTRSANADAIFVSGSDVYVAGCDDRTLSPSAPWSQGAVATLWKNGVAMTLPDDGKGSMATSIFVVGSDVYAAGYVLETKETGPVSNLLYTVAVYWKNGVRVALTDGVRSSDATSIFVSGNDVYVAGNLYAYGVTPPTNNQAMYWKNGNPVMLVTVGGSVGQSIYVSGADVYVAGRDASIPSVLATYWKNGIPVRLTESGAASADQIVVSGNDVYAGGTVLTSQPNSYHAEYWKNGVATALSTGPNHSRATSIAVVRH